MTDQTHGIEPVQEPPPTEERDDALAGAGDFTSGEGLVAFAGIVLVAAWLIFGVLANTYWVAWLAVVPAIVVALLPRLDRARVERYHPLPLMMKALGYVIAIVGVLTIIEDVRFAGSALDEVFEVIGALVTYAGFAMAFLGARQIEV